MCGFTSDQILQKKVPKPLYKRNLKFTCQNWVYRTFGKTFIPQHEITLIIIILKTKIKTFLEINKKGELSSEIMWDALKAVIRGKILSFCASKKKDRQLILSELNKELNNLETRHQKEPTSDLSVKVKDIGNEINMIQSQEIEKKHDFHKTKMLRSWFKIFKVSSKKTAKTTGRQYNS